MSKKDEAEIKFKNYYNYIGREGADRLLAWLEDNGFFEAPASTKFHGNYPGGLAEHSNNVFKRLLKISSDEDSRLGRQYAKYTIDTLATVALLHDVCKMDAYKLVKAEKPYYTYTNAFPVGHGEKSIIQIMRFMLLSDDEMMAIRWHMGGFDYAVKGGSYDMNNAFNACELAAMLHIADMMATHLDERGDKASE